MASLVNFSDIPSFGGDDDKPMTPAPSGGMTPAPPGGKVTFSDIPALGAKPKAGDYRKARERGGFDDADWETYRRALSEKESGSPDGDYSVAGGYNGAYDGRFQLGNLAKLDAADGKTV